MDPLVSMTFRVAARYQAMSETAPKVAKRYEFAEGGLQLAKILVDMTSNYLQNPDLAESNGVTKDVIRVWRELDQALRHNEKEKAAILVRRHRNAPVIRSLGDDIMNWVRFGVA